MLGAPCTRARVDVQPIVGASLHAEIVAMIERAKVNVRLVSPYVRVWPELERAVARAVLRGVRVELIAAIQARCGPTACVCRGWPARQLHARTSP